MKKILTTGNIGEYREHRDRKTTDICTLTFYLISLKIKVTTFTDI